MHKLRSLFEDLPNFDGTNLDGPPQIFVPVFVRKSKGPHRDEGEVRRSDFDLGFAAGYESAQAAIANQLEEARQTVTLAALERDRWSSLVALSIGDKVTDAVEIHHQRLLRSIANALEPMALSVHERQLIEDMIVAVETLRDAENTLIAEVRGPENITARIAQELRARKISVLVIESDSTEIQIRLGATTILANIEKLALSMRAVTR